MTKLRVSKRARCPVSAPPRIVGQGPAELASARVRAAKHEDGVLLSTDVESSRWVSLSREAAIALAIELLKAATA